MNTYETSTTVGGQGDIHLMGVPFHPGTEVEVVISAKAAHGAPAADADQQVAKLLATLNHAHNTEPIGSLNREELHDREILR
jgi:hypothetical protein